MAAQGSTAVRKHGNGHPEAIRRALEIAIPSFLQDPMFTWTLHDFPEAKRREKLGTVLKPIIAAPPTAGGFVLDVEDWAAMMAVSCPGQKYDGFLTVLRCGAVSSTFRTGPKPTLRILVDYMSAVNRLKAKMMASSKFYDCYYIIITATRETHRRRGLMSSMAREVIEWARRDEKPIWLEATSEYSKRQFLRLGFEVVGEMNLGKGSVDAKGLTKKGGEGITAFGMIWRPENKVENQNILKS